MKSWFSREELGFSAFQFCCVFLFPAGEKKKRKKVYVLTDSLDFFSSFSFYQLTPVLSLRYLTTPSAVCHTVTISS